MNDAIDRFLTKRLPSALQLLREWVGCNSYTGNREGVEAHAAQVAAAFAPLGFKAEAVNAGGADRAPHCFLRRSGAPGGRAFLLVSHLDTVFPAEEECAADFAWREAEGRIYGPGTSDIKGGTLMCLLLLEMVRHFHPEVFEQTEWIVALNAAEETLDPSFGAACLEQVPASTRAALVFESDGDSECRQHSNLITSRKGRAIFELAARGHAAHAGAHHRTGANAIRQLARAVDTLEALTDHSRGLTVNVGRIEGGLAFNRVPHAATASFEMRAADPDVFATALRQIHTCLASVPELRSGDGKHRVALELRCVQEDPVWRPNPESEALLGVWQAAGEAIGHTVSGGPRGGLSDGNFLWQALPTIDGLGPGGGNAHASEWADEPTPQRPEFVVPTSFPPKLRLNLEALLRLTAPKH